MSAKGEAKGRWSTARWLLVAGGGVMLVVALLADWLGIGTPSEFGRGQVLLLGAGLVVLGAGLLGARVTQVHRAAAIILLNSLLLLGGLELAAIVVARSGLVPSRRDRLYASYRAAPYYQTVEWSERYWDEAPRAERYRYVPYVLWSHEPFEGETIRIGPEGRRRTSGAECGPGAWTVFVFGGSTMWGWGAPDWATIPAYLQQGLAARSERPVCVVNFGEDGFVATQAVLLLMDELRAGHVPDVALFYDGVNDVTAAHYAGMPGTTTQYNHVVRLFEEGGHTLVAWLKQSRLAALLREVVSARPGAAEPSWDIDSLARGVAELYLANQRLVGALADAYGFRYHFFWQPHIAIGGKALTQTEQALRAALPAGLGALAEAVYERVAVAAPASHRFSYQAGLFDTVRDQLWIDEWGHVTPVGNQLIAGAMLDVLQASGMMPPGHVAGTIQDPEGDETGVLDGRPVSRLTASPP